MFISLKTNGGKKANDVSEKTIALKDKLHPYRRKNEVRHSTSLFLKEKCRSQFNQPVDNEVSLMKISSNDLLSVLSSN